MKKKKKKKDKKKTIFRSAVTGKFVTKKYSKKYPRITERERR